VLQGAVFNLGAVYGVLSGIGADAKALLEVASDAFVVYMGKFTIAGQLLGMGDDADRVIEKYRQAGQQIREFLSNAPLDRMGEMISQKAEQYGQALTRAADPRTPQLRYDWEAGVQTGELAWGVVSLVLGVATGVGAAIKGVSGLTRMLRAVNAMNRGTAAERAVEGLSAAEAALASRVGRALQEVPVTVTGTGRNRVFTTVAADGRTISASSMRDLLLGDTPGKASRTGREVIARMTRDGEIRTIDGQLHVRSRTDNNWYPIDERVHMAHDIHRDYWPEVNGQRQPARDAVTWWNSVGRDTGARSPQVRDMMLDSRNYYLEFGPYNSSQGARLRQTYEPPRRPGG
jgi:hypothetical protein